MNYLPFCGYWFYGATSDAERCHYYASWGLLADAPEPSESTSVLSKFVGIARNMFRSLFINASTIGGGLISAFIHPSDKDIQ